MLPRSVALLLVLATLACRGPSDRAYPPPKQHVPPIDQPRNKIFIFMNDPFVGDYMVQDIEENLEGSTWRWTFDHPELRFHLTDIRDLSLVSSFIVPAVKLKDTGAETVSFFVNDKLLGSETCATGGAYKFSRRVPPGWLQPDRDATVAAQVLPVWQPPNGRHLGVLLLSAGFIHGGTD